jgi:hypothetical protein
MAPPSVLSAAARQNIIHKVKLGLDGWIDVMAF